MDSMSVGFSICQYMGKEYIIEVAETIKDKILVAAMIDQLTHNAHLNNMNGIEYRLKETRAFNKNQLNNDN